MNPTAQDRLTAQIDAATGRLDQLAERIGAIPGEQADELRTRVQRITDRGEALLQRVAEGPDVDAIVQTAVEDHSAAVDALEADQEAAGHIAAEAVGSAVERQARAWRSRLDHLRLQAHLGTMDAVDGLDSLTARLQEARTGLLVDLRTIGSDTSATVDDVRKDFDRLLSDVRDTVEHAADALVKR